MKKNISMLLLLITTPFALPAMENNKQARLNSIPENVIRTSIQAVQRKEQSVRKIKKADDFIVVECIVEGCKNPACIRANINNNLLKKLNIK
ncbi:MAG: hypothetical protein JO129_04275 [Candidatus Dependentiae bacterium]|nr:hypothetical protein [Candidatus Dependentiae bacterium]